ncbi:unnamed protein product [Staurois parvus]|uniref:Uncharacterized protein n=1 Tax=Staurois parvus TaxID=386267 RepID=A0ABN9GX61_9NEOB|nr:unnamed protein product [Staurois parvus]
MGHCTLMIRGTDDQCALMISVAPAVPPVSALQCHPASAHQCYISVPTSAHQCHISEPILSCLFSAT